MVRGHGQGSWTENMVWDYDLHLYCLADSNIELLWAVIWSEATLVRSKATRVGFRICYNEMLFVRFEHIEFILGYLQYVYIQDWKF